MPLPQGGKTPWPPENQKQLYTRFQEYDAWYSGDPGRIAAVHAAQIFTPTPRGRHWAKDTYEERRVMLHIPIAGDMAQTSANLLFSEAPNIRIPEANAENAPADAKKAQERLNLIIEQGGIFNRFIEAAETGAALGGVYLKVNWDVALAAFPILSVAQADTAIPEFQWGFLSAVTFWKVVEDNGHDVIWRLLERHETVNGKGVILNGLYKGNKDELGLQVGLEAHRATQELQPIIETGIDGLIVRYVPNMRPNRLMRGSAIGQSDYCGVEGLMDSLDEVYSSWLKDIRLGQGRLIVPEDWLERRPSGDMTFDIDQEIFTTLAMDPMSQEKAGITISQFKIRTEEHANTAKALIDRIVSTAGYSPQTFGLNTEGRTESGTALNIRERKSFLTKSKKERYFRPAIEDILYIMLQIDNLVFKTGVRPYRPNIEFADAMIQDINANAVSVELLNRAQAASIETKVRLIHPDWDVDQIKAEVKQIMDEAGLVPTDTTDLPV